MAAPEHTIDSHAQSRRPPSEAVDAPPAHPRQVGFHASVRRFCHQPSTAGASGGGAAQPHHQQQQQQQKQPTRSVIAKAGAVCPAGALRLAPVPSYQRSGRNAAFAARCRRLRMPDAAIESWLDETAQPRAYCASYFCCAALHIALWTATYMGDLGALTARRRALVRACALALAATGVCQMCGLFYMGPRACRCVRMRSALCPSSPAHRSATRCALLCARHVRRMMRLSMRDVARGVASRLPRPRSGRTRRLRAC